MPAFHLRCNQCQKTKRRILPKFKELPCDCGGVFERQDVSISTQVKEVLDNGAMVRKVERLADIDAMVKERSKELDGDDFI